MGSQRAKWATLLARISTGSGFGLAGLHQAGLRRQIAARMQTRGLRSHEAYIRLLETNPSEYTALTSALRSTIHRGARRGQMHPGRAWGSQLRQWTESLPLPVVVAEGIPSTRGVRLLACNRPAHELLGQAEAALKASGDQWQWLNPDRTPCADEDLPLYQAIWRDRATDGKRLLLRHDDGQARPVVIDACRLSGRRPRAIQTIQTLGSQDAGPGAAPSKARPDQAGLTRYQHLFEEAPNPLILTDSSGMVLEANARARQLFSATEEGVEGASLARFLTNGALRTFHETLVSLTHSGSAQARISVQAQPERVLEAQAREIPAGEGPVVEWVLHDVTGHVATEQLRRDLVDLLLHDLRSPLATSILGVEASERGLERADPPRTQRSLSMVAAALRRLGRLVDSLLDTSRLEAGQSILRSAEVEPSELLSAVADEVELAVRTHSLQLKVEISSGLPTIVADSDMLFRAVINLLDNAIKFSPPNGEIRLTATAQDYGILITVSDEGPGIPHDLQPRIFDKFVGLHLPQAPRGYGLGLAFCKLAIEAHGGWVAVDSTPGQGSTFALWLPTQPETPDAPGQNAA